MLNFIFHRYSCLISSRFAAKCNYSQKIYLKMDRIRTVIVDLSGTIHIEDKEIPGSVEALKRLKSSDLNVKFVTNTTKESCDCLLRRLTKIGFDIKQSDLFTSLTAARRLIQKKNVRPLLLVDDRALEDFKGINTEDPNAVVIGLAPDKFSYENMNTAFRLVLDKADLIAIHKARYYKTSDGLSLGPGPFVTALEYASDVKAEVVGKPEKSFFLASIEEFKCQPEECVMIGDDARDDIAGAQKAGMKGILVQTGKYRPGDESKFTPEPHKIVNNFSDAVDYILMSKSSSS